MLAYTKTVKKEDFVRELKMHQMTDAFVRGNYETTSRGGFKGCAIGCSLESISRLKKINIATNEHAQYEEHLGIPEWLAFVEDRLFEAMSLNRSRSWPVDFAEAINEGSDLEKARIPFIVVLLEHCIDSMSKVVFDFERFQEVTKAIAGSKAAVFEMIEAQKEQNFQRLRSAETVSWDADVNASRAAARAVNEWYSADAAWSAESAKFAARSASWSAANGAQLRAEGVASAALGAASSAESATGAARTTTCDYYADRLLEILRETK